jgi:hypothetical protein
LGAIIFSFILFVLRVVITLAFLFTVLPTSVGIVSEASAIVAQRFA